MNSAESTDIAVLLKCDMLEGLSELLKDKDPLLIYKALSVIGNAFKLYSEDDKGGYAHTDRGRVACSKS